jgi:hypothetical protein
MAATLLGLNTVTFGAPASVPTMLCESVSWTTSSEIAEVKDEDGDIVAAALHGVKTTCSVSGTSTGAVQAIGTVLAITGAPTGSFFVTESSIERSADGFQKFSYTTMNWAGITAT